jgi:hypothetical protein
MTWVAWRQHRSQLAIAALLTAVFGVVIVVTGLPLHDALANLTPACLGGADTGAACQGLRDTIEAQFEPASTVVVLTGAILPALIGVFIGAPLVAREYEQGTYRLAWTQSIGRERWLLVKIAVLGAAVIAIGVAFVALVAWWRGPLDTLEATPWAAYDAEALAPMATTLLGFMAGVTAGGVIRRSVPAIAVAFAALAGLKWVVISFVRPYLFMTPLTASWPPGVRPPVASVPGWYFDLYPVSATGQHLSSAELVAVVQATGADDPTRGMQLAGVTWTQVYQPADRFWPFQSIEAALLLLVALALLVLATWWIARRT